MRPVDVAHLLFRRGLDRAGHPGALWLASAAALAWSWRTGPDGAPVLAAPTTDDVEAFAANASGDSLPPDEEREEALRLLRSIATPCAGAGASAAAPAGEHDAG